jgi:dimethylglycine dehydrogenase
MKSHARVVVIGGGVVGCSVLYHLAKRGWSDVVLCERSELTSGSTWHAAGGMHTINGDANVSSLQAYTIKLYEEIERESGQSCGIHRVGCLYLAGTELRRDYFKSECAKALHIGLDLVPVTMDEVRRINPLVDTSRFIAAMFDPNDGHVDPSGVTQAYAKAARKRGAEIYRQTPVIELKRAGDGWLVVTPQGTIAADYVVNAAGLWAREVALLAGIRLPIVPMEHQYVVTEPIAAVAALDREIPMTIDFEGESYLRQEQKSLLIGTYEQACKHWSVAGTPKDFGHELIAPDLDRMSDGLEVAMQVYPCLREGGIKRVINGGMVFAPDGNPTIGPVPGVRNFFCACGVMAGFSQGGGVGLAVANWIVDGEPGMDVFAMDVARFGDFATDAFVLTKTEENYRRRFAMTCPNEELEAARPLRTTPIYDRLRRKGALFGSNYGWEYPLWFGADGMTPRETPTFRRSESFPAVAEECRAVRTGVGLWETSTYCKFEVSGTGAAAWLDRLVTNKLPSPGRIGLCPLLTPSGRLLGDFTVARLGPDRFLMIGSPQAENFYTRWFDLHAGPGVGVRAVTGDHAGFSISGPKARDLLAKVTGEDVSNAGLPFLAIRRMAIGLAPVLVIRISFTGELGYEIYMAPEYQPRVHDTLVEAGGALGLRHFGARALNSLRLEKGYGAWGREYTQDYTPAEAGLGRFVRFDKGDFIGRDAARAASAAPPSRRLSILAVESGSIDPLGNEPVLADGKAIGRVTSGGHGHWVERNIALAYLPGAEQGKPIEIEILGERFPARVLAEPLYDPEGQRLRG